MVAEADQALPGAQLSLVDLDDTGPDQSRLGSISGASYTSWSHEQWISVIELAPPSLGLSLACEP